MPLGAWRGVACLLLAMALAVLPATGQAREPWRQRADLVAARVAQGVAAKTVSPAAFRTATDPDDTRSIQAALDTGHSVVLEPHRVYVIAHTVLMRPNQRLSGGKGTVLKAKAGWVRPRPPDRNGYTMISNAGYLSDELADSTLMVEGMTLDGTAITYAVGAFHGIGFRRARDVVVRGVHCIDMGNCTAMEASDGTLVTDSSAEGITNVAFDHWEGPRNATVRNVRVVGRNNGTGVMFTAGAGVWTQQRVRRGGNVMATGVEVRGSMLAGVVANVLSNGSGLSGVHFADIDIDTSHRRGASGVVITGDVSDVTIEDVVIANIEMGMAIGVRPDRWGRPRNVRVRDAVIRNASTGPSNFPVTALGEGHLLERIRFEGGSYRYAIWTDDPATRVIGPVRPGEAGAILHRPRAPAQ